MTSLTLALRDILISLMGSTTPCPNHFAHSFSREALAAHEVNCPTITHALVPELYFALDPDFLTCQVRRGVFDLGIFNMLGEAIKVHCAPVRDGMVDTMVQTALSGDVALGLRQCFDCVEVMKLVSFFVCPITDARTLPTTRFTHSGPISGNLQSRTNMPPLPLASTTDHSQSPPPDSGYARHQFEC